MVCVVLSLSFGLFLDGGEPAGHTPTDLRRINLKHLLIDLRLTHNIILAEKNKNGTNCQSIRVQGTKNVPRKTI